jgi:hypothetical protein
MFGFEILSYEGLKQHEKIIEQIITGQSDL